jgi:hypothetical protein
VLSDALKGSQHEEQRGLAMTVVLGTAQCVLGVQFIIAVAYGVCVVSQQRLLA